MILTCPACQTQYVLPENAIGAKGRMVKCASCAYSWRQEAITVTEIDLTQPETPFTGPEEDVSASSMAQQLRWQQAAINDIDHIEVIDNKKVIKIAALWMGLFLLLTAMALGYGRTNLVRAWPATALLYEALHVPAPAAGVGLKFGDDTAANFDPQAIPARLHVSGRFTNTKSRALRLPILQARLFDKDGKWLKDWAIPITGINYMAGKQSLAFDYSLPQVPDEAYSLTFRFVDE
ncbi:MAG TPA: zinc-ribbon domain-containing protein [Alphaproteobacteria bacterium]